MYKVIGHPQSRAIRVIWMMEELGVPYEIVPVAPRSDEAKEYNPSGKVPALVVDGECVIDSVAIVQFLADKHDKFTNAVGTIKRAQQDSWTQFAVDEFESALWTNAKHSFILPKELRSEEAKTASKYEFDRAILHLEQRLGDKEFVMGEAFTVPDLLLGHCAGWATNGANWDIPAGPAADYFARVRSRPALLRTLEIRKAMS